MSEPILKFLCLLFFMLHGALSITAQNYPDSHANERTSWEEVLEFYSEKYEDYNEDKINEEQLNTLRNIYDTPLNINTVTKQQLLELPFVSETLASNIIDYVTRYGEVLSLAELSLVYGMDYDTKYLLSAFLTCRPPITGHPSAKQILKNAEQTLAVNWAAPLNTPEGYKSNSQLKNSNRYLGDKNRIAVKYTFNYDNELKFGLTSEKDAGEPFACRGNFLMDSYSFFVQCKPKNGKANFIAGDFRARFGEGLLVGNMFYSGKKSVLGNYNTRSTISPHSSYSERDYFRGAALGLKFKKIHAVAFASYNSNDAIINDSNEITSITNTGYHRTGTEQQRRGNLHDFTTAGDISYNSSSFRIGISAALTHYDKRLNPRDALYNKYAMRGKMFHAYSAHYSFDFKNISSQGEAALNKKNALAFVNTIKWQPASFLTFTSVQRSYSMRYNSPYSKSFGSSGKVNNEQGVFFGAVGDITSNLNVRAYADFYRSPWASYRYNASLSAKEFYAEATLHTQKGFSFMIDWRFTRKSYRALAANSDTTTTHKQQLRLQCKHVLNNLSNLTTIVFTNNKSTKSHNGLAVFHRATYKCRRLNTSATVGWFNAKNYNSRIYVYENNVKNIYSNFASFYGNGIRLSLLCSTEIKNKTSIYAKYGFTHYFDRDHIGSGANEIKSSSKHDLAFCINLKI